ncbi:MAG: hypothetical protein ACRERX_22645 [Pseudomonas sp.]
MAWQQLRSTQLPNGDLQLSRDFTDLARGASDNILVIKATYWLGL